ncbi:MAG: nucleotidyltransferase domain-containing protein [Patescibacteria group bacterium]|nr:nucleotidyltransferase domain-containing protein [Patescibacteria group bacterium]
MRLENYSEEKLKKELLNIIKKHIDLEKYDVFFFGSRVGGKGDERSDIDVGISGSESLPLDVISEIKEEVEKIPILYKIDVVDFTSAEEKFVKIAEKNIEIINK